MRVQVKGQFPPLPNQQGPSTVARQHCKLLTSNTNLSQRRPRTLECILPVPGQRHLLPDAHQSSESHLHLSVLFHLQKRTRNTRTHERHGSNAAVL